MYRKLAIRFPAGLLTAVLFASLVGCTKPSAFTTPVGTFRDASSVVIQATKVYLTELNKVERNEYIYSQASKPDQIRLDMIEQRQVFSKEGIAARLNALDQLASYVELLDRLANSDQPHRIKARAADLHAAVNSLSGKIAALSGEDDKKFKAAAGKVFPIIGNVLEAFAQRAVTDAIKKAIDQGAEPVDELITAIGTDIQVAYERRRTSFSGSRVILVDQYNREFIKGADADPAKLKNYADAIAAGEDRWEAFLTAQPNDGLEAMKRANAALVKFARTPKPGITDFAAFVDAMESFAAAAGRIGKVVQSMTGKE